MGHLATFLCPNDKTILLLNPKIQAFVEARNFESKNNGRNWT